MEGDMDEHDAERRDFLKRMSMLGTAGVVAGLRPGLAQSGQASGESKMKTTYDPAAKFDIKVSEVDFLRTAGGRQLRRWGAAG